MQTCLEKKGIESRNETIVRNDYNKSEKYEDTHIDALSNGDVKGKGTGHGGHTHSIPDCNKPSVINYSNFNTENGGGLYDIEGFEGRGGRRFLQTISLYNEENQYGAHMIDTRANRDDSQISI